MGKHYTQYNGKEKFFLSTGICLLLLASFVFGRLSVSKKNNSFSQRTLTAVPVPTAPSELAAEISTSASVSGTFRVTRVIDGDTIEIEGGEHVRYIGIDAPETVDPRKEVQCFGIEASKKNKEFVEGKTVRLEKDITDRDKYGRLLRYVWVDSPSAGSEQALFVNLELVKQGFATSDSYPPDIKYQKEFLEAEKEAREVKRGLWEACVASITPTVQVQEPSKSQCNIKGNISASGEKIYHLPECGSYAKTQIDEKRGERWFCSEEEALEAGWRKALNCP